MRRFTMGSWPRLKPSMGVLRHLRFERGWECLLSKLVLGCVATKMIFLFGWLDGTVGSCDCESQQRGWVAGRRVDESQHK